MDLVQVVWLLLHGLALANTACGSGEAITLDIAESETLPIASGQRQADPSSHAQQEPVIDGSGMLGSVVASPSLMPAMGENLKDAKRKKVFQGVELGAEAHSRSLAAAFDAVDEASRAKETEAAEDQAWATEHLAQCTKDAEVTDLQAPAIVRQEAESLSQGLFTNVADEYLAYLQTGPISKKHGILERREAYAQSRFLKVMRRQHIKMRKAMRDAGVPEAELPAGDLSGVRAPYLEPMSLLSPRYRHRTKWGWFKKATNWVKNTVAKVANNPIVKKIVQGAKAIGTTIKTAVKQGFNAVTKLVKNAVQSFMSWTGGLLKAAVAGWKNLQAVVKCIMNPKEERYKLTNMMKPLSKGSSSPSEAAKDLSVIGGLFSKYVKRSINQLRTMANNAISNGMKLLKKIANATRGMNFSSFWSGKWMTDSVKQIMNYFDMMISGPATGPFGCVSKHLIVPALKSLVGMIVGACKAAFKVAKDTYNFLVGKAVSWLSTALTNLIMKWPSVKVAFSLAQDSAFRFCMTRAQSASKEVGQFVANMSAGSATEAKYKRLYQGLIRPFDFNNMGQLVAHGINEIVNFSNGLLQNGVHQASSSMDSLKQYLNNVAAKTTAFAFSHLKGPLKDAIDWSKMVIKKYINIFIEVCTQVLISILDNLRKGVMMPIVGVARNVIMITFDGIEFLMEGLFGLIPEVGAGVLDLVTEPMMAIETLVGDQIPKMLNGLTQKAVNALASVFKGVESKAMEAVDKMNQLVDEAEKKISEMSARVVDEALKYANMGTQMIMSKFTGFIQTVLGQMQAVAALFSSDVPTTIDTAFKNAFGAKAWKVARWILPFLYPFLEALKKVALNVTGIVGDKMKDCDRMRNSTAGILKAAWDARQGR